MDDRGFRVVLEVRTVTTQDGFRVDTPVGYFCQYDGHGVSLPTDRIDRIMIANEEFAKLRASGAIKPMAAS